MLRALLLALAASTALTAVVQAIEYPARGRDDPNMRTAAYSPSQRYLIVGTLKRQTTITFGKGETVIRVAFGDPDTWETQKSDRAPRNSVVIWPLSTALTNMQVTTELADGSERTYQGSLHGLFEIAR